MIRSTLRAAFRQLRQDAGYAIAFILTLGLGIGATHGDLLGGRGRPDPAAAVSARRSHRLHAAAALGARATTNTLFSFVEAADYRTQATTLEEVVEYGDWQFNVVGLGEPRVAYGGLVTSNYFKVLAIHPFLGRALRRKTTTRGAQPVAVLTYEFWQRATGADRDIVGKTIELTGVPTTIVGVLEPGSHYAGTQRAELYANYPTNAHYMGASMQNERHASHDGSLRARQGRRLARPRASGRHGDRQAAARAYPADYPGRAGLQHDAHAVARNPRAQRAADAADPDGRGRARAARRVRECRQPHAGAARQARARARRSARRSARRRASCAGELLVEHLVLAAGGALLGTRDRGVARGGLAGLHRTAHAARRRAAAQQHRPGVLAARSASRRRCSSPGRRGCPRRAPSSSSAAAGGGQRSTSGTRRAARAAGARRRCRSPFRSSCSSAPDCSCARS